MPLPSDWTTKAFADDHIDSQGDPVVGNVTFSLNNLLVHNGDGPTVEPTDINVTLDPTGHFEVTLPVTDDPDYVPATGQDPTSYTVTYELIDSVRGRRLKKQPAPFVLTVESALPDVKLRLRTKQAYGGTSSIAAVDNGDGSFGLSGSGVTDNGDGTFALTGPSVVDHGDGTYTYIAG